MILFHCDYVDGCHPEILQRLLETNDIQAPGYGKDEFCERARQLIKEACGLPDAEVEFMVGGTQTNATVISSVLRPHQGVICASTAHINVHETGAVEHAGHKPISLPSKQGKITGDQVRELMEAYVVDPNIEHTVQPGMVYISFPTELGTVYTKQEFKELKEACNEWHLPLYIDGARLGYGIESKASEVNLKDIASAADIFYIGGTKQGTLFGEAVVIKQEELKRDFRCIMKTNGALLAKGRLLGIQFSVLFENGLYFKSSRHADKLAERIAEGFKKKGYPLYVESHTNQIFPILPDKVIEKLSENFRFVFWERIDKNHCAVRFCTSWATTEEQVNALIEALPSA